jgi:flagellar motor protein MotB
MNVTHFRTALTLALMLPLAVSAQDVDEAPLGEAVERHLSLDEPIMQWVQDPERVDHEVADTIELREGLANGLETIKLTGLVPPIYFETGVAQIPDTTVASLGKILDSMRDRMNVRLHLVGHADNQPLSARLVAIYGDNLGLSRERAGEVAEYMQTALALPPEGVSYTWEGDLNPAASNNTAAGRAQNRRVEVGKRRP